MHGGYIVNGYSPFGFIFNAEALRTQREAQSWRGTRERRDAIPPQDIILPHTAV
jgi:hypothetical protein